MNNEGSVKKYDKAVIIALIVAIVALSLLGVYAWARYVKSEDGTSVAQVAKWNFKIRPGESIETQGTPLAMTRDDSGLQHVVDDVLAPGTYGSIPVFVDTSGTETLMRLELKFKITDCPRNIKFYSDSARSKPIEFSKTTENGKNVVTVLIVKEYSLDSNASNYVNAVHDETIYWGWGYRTVEEGEEIEDGDSRDTQDSVNNATLVISAYGVQILQMESSMSRLSDVAQVGQKVNYNPGNYSISPEELNVEGATLEGELSTNSYGDNSQIKLASKEENKIAAITSTTTWRILDINEATGAVRLIPDEPTSVQLALEGKQGYINAVRALDKVASIYGNGNGATGAKSLTIEDVNKIEGYNPVRNDSSTYTYSGGRTFLVEDENGNVEEQNYNSGEMYTVSYRESTPTRSTDESYKYTTNSDLFANKMCWLASRIVIHGNYSPDYRMRTLDCGNVVLSSYLFIDKGDRDYNYVMPVVTLRAGIRTTGQDENEVWQLK